MKPEDIYFLVGCEESQTITIELRKLGVQAFSCDLKPCSGGHPEWHIQGDVFGAIGHKNKSHVLFSTQDDEIHCFDKWHAAIFHPECTYLTVSGLHWNWRTPGRAEKTEEALQFVCDLLNCGIPYIRIENPVGCISTRITYALGSYQVIPIRNLLKWPGLKSSQTIQPYQFGENASKATCLWNIGFPNITINPYDYDAPRITPDGKKRWGNQTDSGQNKLAPSPQRKALRSKTYHGIAIQIAIQSTNFLTQIL
jgi:hypothetical protein